MTLVPYKHVLTDTVWDKKNFTSSNETVHSYSNVTNQIFDKGSLQDGRAMLNTE